MDEICMKNFLQKLIFRSEVITRSPKGTVEEQKEGRA